jgi:hypothetical protein
MSDDELGLRIDMIDTLSTPVGAGSAGAGRVRDSDDEAILHTAVERVQAPGIARHSGVRVALRHSLP